MKTQTKELLGKLISIQAQQLLGKNIAPNYYATTLAYFKLGENNKYKIIVPVLAEQKFGGAIREIGELYNTNYNYDISRDELTEIQNLGINVYFEGENAQLSTNINPLDTEEEYDNNYALAYIYQPLFGNIGKLDMYDKLFN